MRRGIEPLFFISLFSFVFHYFVLSFYGIERKADH